MLAAPERRGAPICGSAGQAIAGSDATTLPPSMPVVLNGFTGIFQAAPGSTARPVLMLSPIGFEELCGRAFFTRLADALAARGLPSLRFDYPGTADALDATADALDDWRVAARLAADRLRELTGQDTIAVLGQGLGAALALEWAADLGRIGAMALLEPPTSGRAYLRGLKAWGAVLASATGSSPDPAEADGVSVAGMTIPAGRAAAIGALEPSRLAQAPAPSLLLLARPGSGTAHRKLAARLEALSTALTEAEFTGYDALLTDPTSAVIPEAAVATIVDWLGQGGSEPAQQAAAPPARTWPAHLQGDGFVEQPLRFGPDGRLAGVLCRPANAGRQHRGVILLNAGRDYHIGWGRATVLQARALAHAGVASLRFDVSGIGDSRAPRDPVEEVLYSSQQCDDLRSAIDLMAGEGYASVGLVGRCSGGWAAFTVGVEDPRVDALALLNVSYFLWDPTKKLADVIRFAQRNVGDLGATFLKRAGLRRLLKGDLDIRGAARFAVRQANLLIVRRYAVLLGRLTPETRRYHDLHRLFATLEKRNVRTRLIYAAGDGSLGELRSFMGSKLGRLPRYPRTTVREVAGADHNFTNPTARRRVQEELVVFFGAPMGRLPEDQHQVEERQADIRAMVKA